MRKLSEYKAKIYDLFLENKKIFSILFWIIFVIFVSLLVFFNFSKNGVFTPFEVSWGNFDLWIKKLPYNVKTIDITFSQDILQTSVSKDIFKITPNIPGVLKLKDTNTLSYELSEKLAIWQDYTIEVSSTLTSTKNKTLENDLVYIVSAVPWAKVIKVLPEEKLENISKNIAVFFSIPQISLTSLEQKNNISCPIEITPKIEWKCSWTTTSVVEFIPKTTFAWATKYDYEIKYATWMNYELENNFTWSFSTPELQIVLNDTFQPKNAIDLSFNFPVTQEEITKNLTLYTIDQNDKTSSKWVEMKYKIEPLALSETTFFIKPLAWDFYYDTAYKVDIKKWLKPKYWNISLTNDFEKQIKSTSLVSEIQRYKNIFSNTWVLIDTTNMTYSSEFLSNSNEFFNINFLEEIALSKDLFEFKNKKTWENIDFSIEYNNMENEKKEIVPNKNSIKLTLKDSLENAQNYELKILKKSNTSLSNDIVYDYATSPELKVLDYKFIDYSKSCLYLNNSLGYYVDNKYFSFSNSWTIKNVSQWEYIYDWNFEKSLENLSLNDKNQKLIEAWYCPEAGTGQILYAIQTRLNPNMQYNFSIKNLVDIYDNVLKTDFKKSIKTWEIKQKDKYVYTHFNNFTNVFPLSVPVVFNIQTINTDKVFVDVCEMDENEYKTYLKSPYWEFSCGKKVSKTLTTKNNFWNISHNKFDLEDDILWYKSKSNYIWIEVYSSQDKSKSNNYSKNLIVRTNLSVFLEKASNKSLAYATDLEKNIEVPNLEFEFYDFDYKKTTVKYSYDKTKKVYVIDSDLNAISYILVKNDKYSALISQDDFFSNYDFKYISGQDSSVKNYAYIYTDRPIYRPGDEVQIKWLLREFNFDWFKKSDIKSWTLNIIDENWETYRSLEVTIDKNSNFTGSFIIPKDSILWNFRLEFAPKWNENYVYSNWYFSIEEYKKPTFKVDIESDKNDLVIWEKSNFKVMPKYYFWGKILNTTWKYSILTQNYFFDAKDYSDYQFWEWYEYFDCIYWWYCNYSDSLSGNPVEYKIDENWEYSLNYDFGTWSEKIYTFNFDVVDPDTKKTVSNSVSKVLHTTNWYAWVKSNYYNFKKSWIDFDIVTLDFEAKPLTYKKVKVDILQKENKQVRKLWVDGVFYNEYSIKENLEKSFTLVTDQKWYVKYNYKPKNSWEYILKVSFSWDNWQTFVSSKELYVAGEDYVSWWNDNNTVTELEAEKITYKLWETAIFTLKSPVNNWKALFVVEKDDGILDYFIHDIKSYWDKIELKITDKYYPNVYLKAYLIWTQEWNPLPVYKRALWVVKVLTEYKKLNISILTDKQNYKPADKMEVSIEVTDANWKVVPNANWSLSVVDESVLALKWNPRKNPYSFFYDMKRYLWTLSYSNLKYLVEKLEVKDVSGWEKWWAWDQVKGWDTKKLRWNFKDTAFWISDFTTDKTGKAKITIPVMPDNLTTWVIEALVSTPEDNKIWVNYLSVMTSTPVMVEDNLPRFLSSSDKINFSPVIYNRTGKDDEFKVSLKATNWNVKSIDKNIFIKNNESQKVEFLFEVNDSKDLENLETSKIEIIAQSKSNSSLVDGVIKYLPIYPTSLIETTSTVWKTKDVSFDEKIYIPNSETSKPKITLNYSATLFSYLLDGINYLNAYPYGCSEQRTSVIMPNIYIKKLYNVAWADFDLTKKMVKKYISNEVWYEEISVDELIKDYLTEIKKFQNTDWWFMYWNDGDYKYSDIHLTSYIISSLSQIQSIWYEVDKKMITQASNYLKNEFYNKPTCWENITQKCVWLELKKEIILALNSVNNSDYEAYKMYKILDLKNISKLEKLHLISQISNITSLSQTEKEQLKQESLKLSKEILSNELVFNPKWAFISSSNYSRIFNTAQFLEIIWNIWLENFGDYQEIIDNMIRFIASSNIDNSFGSTYDNAWVIRFLTSYLEKTNELKNTSLFARFNLNNKEIQSKKIDKNNIFEVYSTGISTDNISKNNIFNVEKTWSWNIYYSLNLSYYVSSKDIKSTDEWFFVDKKYYSFNEYKKIESLKNDEYQKYLNWETTFEKLKYPREVVEYLTPITSWKIWDLVLVYNKVVTNEARDQVAFESFIPSWTEIVNTSLSTEDKTVDVDIATNVVFDRKELRDDRFFAWKKEIYPWIYNFSYVLRLTHSWNFEVKPTQVSEFYNREVFGRSSGEEFRVE